MAKKKYSGPLWRTSEHKKKLYSAFENNEEFVLFDVETTGLNPEKDRIIQISGIRLFPECDLYEETGRINLYIRPPFEINDKIVEITGITNDFLSTQKSEDEVLDEIVAFFGHNPSLAAYNSSFDIRFLTELYKRHSLSFKVKTEHDVLAMARDLVRPEDTNNYQLQTITKLYGLDAGLSFHNSFDDVIATNRLLEVFINEYREKDAEDERIKLMEEEIRKTTDKTIASIRSMRFWEGYRGFSRIYVNTDVGTVYYDIRTKIWGEKDEGVIDIIDMEQLQADAYELAGATNEIEFARYRGGVA